MQTGNTPKSALRVARIALLAGVSAAALSLGGQANAQVTCSSGFAVDGSATGCGPNQSAGVSGAGAPNSTAIGNAATAYGNNSVALGYQPAAPAGAFGTNSIAIGTNPNAGNGGAFNTVGQNAIAIGTNSAANTTVGNNGIAIGANATANNNNSVAIGANAVTTANNQIVLGAAGTTTQVQTLDVATGANITGGLGVTGGSTTDTLKVTGTSTFQNAASFTDAFGGSTTISGGFVTVTGGSNTNAGGTVSTLTFGNAAQAVSGGFFVNNGEIVTGGAAVTGGLKADTLNVTGGETVAGGATFTSSSPNGNTTTIDAVTGAITQSGNGTGAGHSIVLNASADTASFTGMTVTVSNVGGTSKTTITDGSITSAVAGAGSTNIFGGFVTVNGTYTGGVGGLNVANAAVFVNGGSITNNGAIVNGGFIANGGGTVSGGFTANGGSTLNGGATVNGPTQLNGSLAVAPGNNISMGNNVVHDVATPVVGTDAANKAYVDTTVGKARQQAFEGTAVALAISQPVFLPGQNLAIRGGWGDYQGQNAAGLSAAGVIARDTLGYGSTVVLDAGIGVGGSGHSAGGKAGVTFGFGGTAPLR